MAATNVKKLVGEIPVDVKRTLKSHASACNVSLSKLFLLHFSNYTSSGYKSDFSSFIKANLSKSFFSTNLVPVNFYLPFDYFDRFERISNSNLRSLRSQSAHFALFIYFSITNKPLLP